MSSSVAPDAPRRPPRCPPPSTKTLTALLGRRQVRERAVRPGWPTGARYSWRRAEQPVLAIAFVERQQRLERLRRVVDRGPRVAVALQPARDARERELVGMDVVELLPGDRRRDLGARAGAHRPRPEDRLVRRVLVVVDEDPLPALLLPPRGGEDVGTAALELARRGHRGEANGIGVPARGQPDVDVQSSIAGRLGKADNA